MSSLYFQAATTFFILAIISLQWLISDVNLLLSAMWR